MPEALAIFAVVVVSVGVYVAAWIQAKDPANYNAQRELVRLKEQQRLLQQRLSAARREKWGMDMIETISEQLDASCSEFEEVKAKMASQTVARS